MFVKVKKVYMSSKDAEKKVGTADNEIFEDLDKVDPSQCPDPKIMLKGGKDSRKGAKTYARGGAPELETETPCTSSEQDKEAS